MSTIPVVTSSGVVVPQQQADSARAAVDVATAKIEGIEAQLTSLEGTLATIQEAIGILEQEISALQPPSASNYWRTEQKREGDKMVSVRVFDSARFNADMSRYLSTLASLRSQLEGKKQELANVEQQIAQKGHELTQAQQDLTKAEHDLEKALQNDARALQEARERYERTMKQAQEAEQAALQAEAEAQKAQDDLAKAEEAIDSALNAGEQLGGGKADDGKTYAQRCLTWKPGDPPVFTVTEPVDEAALNVATSTMATSQAALLTAVHDAASALPQLVNGHLVACAATLTAEDYYRVLPNLASYQNGWNQQDAGLLMNGTGQPDPTTKLDTKTASQMVNAWLEAGFTMDQITEALGRLAAAGTASDAIVMAAANRNDPLKANNLDQFIPDAILNSGDPDLIRKWITDSNKDAYSDDIAKVDKKIADLMSSGAPQDVIDHQMPIYLAEKQAIIDTRDKQTGDGIAEFDKFYAAQLKKINDDPKLKGLPDKTKMGMATLAAGKQYNSDFVFYGDSECVPLAGPTTLFAKGTGDSNDVVLNDISQGYIGDCYFMSAIGAVAMNDPDAIKKMIHDNGDGTYTVTFHREVPDNSFPGIIFGWTKDEEVKIAVDANVPSNGMVANSSGDTDGSGKTEIWPQILEKAYAQFKGSYGAIGFGGNPGDALYAITGHKAPEQKTKDLTMDDLSKALAEHKNVEMATCGIQDADKPLLATYGVVENHAYVLQDIRVDADGNKYVILYNPWGPTSAPKPIPFDVALKLFPSLWMN